MKMIEWRTSIGLVEYEEALSEMEKRVCGIVNNMEKELIWFLEHKHVYTAGISASDIDLLDSNSGVPVKKIDRGGKYTYHGPGQRVVYVLLDLKKHNRISGIKNFVYALEQWIINVLSSLNVVGFRKDGMIGVWVNIPGQGHCKIGAIGIKVKKWVSYHGLALNVSPDLAFFQNIVPCGIRDFGVTSLEALGCKHSMADIDKLFYLHQDVLWDL